MNILLGIPCYGGVINVETAQSLIRLQAVLQQNKIEYQYEFLTCESLISRGRNTIVAKFMSDAKFTHLLFIDADLMFNCDAVIKMLKEDKEIIGCPYPKKKYNWDKVKKHGYSERDLPKFTDINYNLKGGETISNGSVLPVKDIPTGFMLIKKSLISNMMLCYPERQYKNNIAGMEKSLEPFFYDLFGTGVVDGIYLSEDYYFCHLIKEMGVELFLETGYTFGHIGREVFFGNLALQLKDGSDDLNQDKLLLKGN